MFPQDPSALSPHRQQALVEQVEDIAPREPPVCRAVALFAAGDHAEQHQRDALGRVGKVHRSSPSGCYSFGPMLAGGSLTEHESGGSDCLGFNPYLLGLVAILASWVLVIGAGRLLLGAL